MPPTVSLREVARQAGVSPTAVSQAMRAACKSTYLSDNRRTEIIRVAKKSGYRPNDDIAVIMLSRDQGPDPFLVQAFIGIHAVLQKTGNRTVLEQAPFSEIPEVIRNWQCGGVLFLEHTFPSAIEMLEEKGIAYGVINPTEHMKTDCISSDDGIGITKGLQWLKSQGCDTFVLVLPEINHCSFDKRVDAYNAYVRDRDQKPFSFHSVDLKQNIAMMDALPTGKNIGFITIYEWHLALDVAMSQNHQVKVMALKSMNQAWGAPVALIDIPLTQMGQQGVAMIHAKWEKRCSRLPSRMVEPKILISEV